MRRAFVASLLFLTLSFLEPVFARDYRADLSGSGSTFAFPIVSRWAQAYEKQTGVRIQYQPIGSAAGVTEIEGKVVDFCVTDAPLVDAQLLRDGLTQFPLVIGDIVPVVN